MVTTQPSLLDLTSRLPDHIGREVSQATFRPNMVVTGAGLVAWQEDGWVGEVKLGESAVLTYSKDCTRCTATKVRPGTETDGEKVWFEDQSRDWRTLRSERASRHSEEVPATRPQSQDHQESCRGQSHLRDALHHVVPGYVHRPPLEALLGLAVQERSEWETESGSGTRGGLLTRAQRLGWRDFSTTSRPSWDTTHGVLISTFY